MGKNARVGDERGGERGDQRADRHVEEDVASGVFARGAHAGPRVVERVLRAADESRRRGDSFRRFRRLGAPPEWHELSIAQRRAIEVLVWGLRVERDDTW